MTESETAMCRSIQIRLVDGRGHVVDDLLTIEQAARLLEVSQARVSQLISDGTFEKFPLSNRCALIARQEVERYAASYRKPGRKPPAF